jgi:hypothetical protein
MTLAVALAQGLRRSDVLDGPVAEVVQDAGGEAVRVFLERAVRLADSPRPRVCDPGEAARDTRA